MAGEKIDIDYVAQLARLELTPEEKQTFSAQLEQVLGYMQVLNKLDTEGVEPTAHAFPLENVLDEDEPTEPLSPQEALRNAPLARDNFVVVPKVVGDA